MLHNYMQNAVNKCSSAVLCIPQLSTRLTGRWHNSVSICHTFYVNKTFFFWWEWPFKSGLLQQLCYGLSNDQQSLSPFMLLKVFPFSCLPCWVFVHSWLPFRLLPVLFWSLGHSLLLYYLSFSNVFFVRSLQPHRLSTELPLIFAFPIEFSSTS